MSRVVVYDSGVGGLSIHREVRVVCPQHDTIFVSDNQAFPYGIKPEAQLIERVLKMVERIGEHYAPDILVVACNTASTLTLPVLRATFDFEIVGVVPAVKPAVGVSRTQHIGLLATPATVGRNYTTKLITKFAGDCTFIKVGSSALVEMVERKLRGHRCDVVELEHILQPFIEHAELDVLVLGCTHFPLLNKEINDIFNKYSKDIKLVDSGQAVAARVRALGDTGSGYSGESIAAFTQSLDEPRLFEHLAQMGFSEIQLLSV